MNLVFTIGCNEEDETVVLISISELVRITFFSGTGILECMYVLLMILLTNLFYLVTYVVFLFPDGTSSFCIAGFCICFDFLGMLRGIDVTFHRSNLLMVF